MSSCVVYDLRNPGIGFHQHQQAEHAGAHRTVADGPAEIAPQRDLRAADVEANQVWQDADVDGLCRPFAARWLALAAAFRRSGLTAHRQCTLPSGLPARRLCITATLAADSLVGENGCVHFTRRQLLSVAGTGLALGSLGACAPRAARDGSPLELRYASPYSPGHPYSRADFAWMAELQRLSAGQLQIRPFWGGALIGESDSVRELSAGVADISYVLPIYTRAGAHLIRAQAAFYQGTSTMQQQEQVFAELWQQFPALRAELPGVQKLLVTGGPPLQIMTGTRPIQRLRDLQGLRLRVPSELASVIDRFDVDAEFMPMGEVYTSISKGTVDGVIAPYDVLRAMRLAEVVKHVAVINIPRGAYPSRAINLAREQGLAEIHRAAIQRSLPAWQQAMHTEVARATEAGMRYARELGVRFTTVPTDDVSEFGQIYSELAAARAADLDARGMPGSAVLTAAQRIIRDRGFA
jgi:TRAP-type C4-dicarboxylate transport system substrate-binding protein